MIRLVLVKCYNNKMVKSPLILIIVLLIKNQVANQQQQQKKSISWSLGLNETLSYQHFLSYSRKSLFQFKSTKYEREKHISKIQGEREREREREREWMCVCVCVCVCVWEREREKERKSIFIDDSQAYANCHLTYVPFSQIHCRKTTACLSLSLSLSLSHSHSHPVFHSFLLFISPYKTYFLVEDWLKSLFPIN